MQGLLRVHSEICWLRQPRQSGSWAVDEVVVGARVAGIGGGGVVLGVGVCVGAGRLECLGAGRGIVAWAVCVGAVGATVGVGRLAERLQVADGAGGGAALLAVGGLAGDVDRLNGGWQVVCVLHQTRDKWNIA